MKKRVVPFLLVAFAIFNQKSFAATATTTFLVSAIVASTCAVAALPLAFGAYDPTSAANLDINTTITVTCTGLTSYNVGLNAGTTGPSVTNRQMSNGSNTIDYALYRNGTHTQNWGDTVGTDTVAGTGNGIGQLITVYGRIPGSQPSVSPGSYSDTITVTVTY